MRTAARDCRLLRLREKALLVFLAGDFFKEELFAELVECLEADVPAVERLPLEPLEFFDAFGDEDFVAGWLSPEEVEATTVLDFF